MDTLRIEIDGTASGVERVSVHDPGGRDAAMETLQEMFPVIKALDRVIRHRATR